MTNGALCCMSEKKVSSYNLRMTPSVIHGVKTRFRYVPVVIQYVYVWDNEEGEQESDGKWSCSENEGKIRCEE